VADGPGVLRADAARRPAAQEDRGGGHGALPGARHVGAAEARDRLAGERGRGPVAPARTRWEGSTKRAASGDTRPWGSPEGGGVLSPQSPSAPVKGDCGERTPGKQAVASGRGNRALELRKVRSDRQGEV